MSSTVSVFVGWPITSMVLKGTFYSFPKIAIMIEKLTALMLVLGGSTLRCIARNAL